MTARPKMGVPPWALNDNYPVSADTWSETETKVEIPAGLQNVGWTPDELPPPQYLNFWQWSAYQWSLYLDAIDIKNWSGSVVINDCAVSGDTMLERSICWDENSGRLFAAFCDADGTTSKIYSSENGVTWASSSPPANRPIRYTCIVSGGIVIIAGGRDTGSRYLSVRSAGAWAALDTNALTGSDYAIFGGCHVPFFDAARRFIFGGGGVGGLTYFIRVSSTGAAATEVSVAIPSGYSGTALIGPDLFAVGADRVLAFSSGVGNGAGDDTDGANVGGWYSDDGITWTLFRFDGSNGVPATTSIQAAWYCTATERFYVACGTEVRSSSDGTAWTRDSMRIRSPGSVAYDIDTDLKYDSVSVCGAIWCAVIDNPYYGVRLHWSTTQGRTWDPVPNPTEGLTTPGDVVITRRVGDRFCALTDGANLVAAFGLRT